MAWLKASGKQRGSYPAGHPKALAVTSWSQGQRPDLSGSLGVLCSSPLPGSLRIWDSALLKWIAGSWQRCGYFLLSPVLATLMASSKAGGRHKGDLATNFGETPNKCQSLDFLIFELEFRAATSVNSKETSEGTLKTSMHVTDGSVARAKGLTAPMMPWAPGS